MKKLTETKSATKSIRKSTPKKSETELLNEQLTESKRMTEYYKDRYKQSVEIRKGLVSENIDLITAFEIIDKKCAEYETEIKKLKRKWWNIFKF